MKRLTFSCSILLAVLSAIVVHSSEPIEQVSSSRSEESQGPLMRAKLASSQAVLEGLVSRDFGKIAEGAEDLDRICQTLHWIETDDQVYAHHRTEMHRLTQKIARTAETRNLEGAAFTYMHMLNVCISCHEHCRDVLKIADDSEINLQIVPIPITGSPDESSGQSLRR
ncbi:hypothetical protein [Rubinisphaera margarita]|uniref:hypothetical protein n=1 Tax=Rubinisphaera margarita TaxID=2909586 RepID=UPI001EE86E18|nr:hypothetical protein [Rubinisphaera margarita]MCG6158283.1 hypothetical protein [Rubinisphaera margarita]